ncbi:BREX-1 system adenine-specific DNA-methyltransferase PglX [Dyadobacter sp. 3J3]|uniref:BREX-1 system adenine-specific DNA-methyltransferase PglX n=1 Tax=Dyadobacter sp. 3J3 TaxID=2606600 RepID=UPI001359D0D6|nr:BREX-1 system adenine-specific DNA-methyltransferase PglX [Dyadobacter sp. 3J3]
MEFVLSQDTAGLRGKEKEIAQLRKKIEQVGRMQLVENVAYTWFNRLMALRFMDANGYTIPKVVTPLEGMSNPEILQNALAGHIEPELKLDRKRLDDLLDGRTATADAHTEAYKMLLIAVCNQLFTVMPFMFERISDYTELLLPDDLLSEYSIVTDIRNGMTDEDCKQEEIIGWLYQFYIADKKDSVFAGLKKKIKITPENIPAATQLFTPRWIVRYMVENTLGKLWLTLKPDSKLREHMPYYIEAPEENAPAPLPEGINGVTDITFLDPCQGSGHVLVYAFDLFTKIYEEEGFNTNEIPALILQNNLFGIDIDERAAQLAAFALTMKARAYYTRFLRKPVQPHVIALENVTEDTIRQAVKLPVTINGKSIVTHNELSLYQLTQADNFGSLITIEPEEIKAIETKEGDLFLQEQPLKLKLQAEFLSKKYHCVVTNPPYTGARNMNDNLKAWLDFNYSEGANDLFSAFIMRCSSLTHEMGLTGMITLHGWMFISTFSELRKWALENLSFKSLVHVGGNSFPSMNSQIARAVSFIFKIQNKTNNGTTICFDLDSIKNSHSVDKESLFKKKREEDDCLIKDFEKFKNVQSNTILYSISDSLLEIFINNKTIGLLAKPRQGLATADNDQFVRFWSEVSFKKQYISNQATNKWYCYNKGGDFRKWYGNNQFVVNWENDGFQIKHNFDSKGKLRSRPQNSDFYFKQGLTYSLIGNTSFCARKYYEGHLFDVGGSGLFVSREIEMLLLGLINSAVGSYLLSKLNPTINFQVGDIANIPVVIPTEGIKSKIEALVQTNIQIAKEESTYWEENYEFTGLIELVEKNLTISDYFSDKVKSVVAHIQNLYDGEKELNSTFTNLYSIPNESGLADSVTINLYGLWKSADGIIQVNDEEILLKCIQNFISYSVGNLFGRYSLDKPGLILANAGDTLPDFLQQIPNPAFMPDEENIVPVLDGEWFTDDVVGRFKVFLKAAFGEEHFEENLRFIEDTLGKDIRKYFVRDFYNDHIKRYKKRPIYWMFSSGKGHFKALIYMHRYQPDLCSMLLNDYLQAFITKLEAARQTQTQLSLREDIAPREKITAQKEIDKIDVILKDCREYEKTLFTLATQKISMDLDDGVKVNYQKFKSVLVLIKGLEKEEE